MESFTGYKCLVDFSFNSESDFRRETQWGWMYGTLPSVTAGQTDTGSLVPGRRKNSPLVSSFKETAAGDRATTPR